LTTTRIALPQRSALFFVALLLTVAVTVLAQGATSQENPAKESSAKIRAEIARLGQSLKDNPFNNPDFPKLDDNISALLQASQGAVDSGRTWSSLEALGRAMDLLNGARTVQAKGETVKSGLQTFETEWGKASVELTALDEQARRRDWSHKPAAARGLAEAAQGKAIPLLEGGRGFAYATKPGDGLFYMGQAQGEAEFSSFLFALKMPTAAAPLQLRSYLPELQRLQEKTNAEFQPPKSIDLHDRFIALNSTLKLAQELDSSRAYAGALYEYLEATRHFAMLSAAVPEAGKLAQLKTALAEEQKRLSASKRDDSIAQIFIDRAQGWLAHPDGSASSSDELRSVQIVVEQVLPAYYAALKPAAPVQGVSQKTVNLTLVRWPYT